ncbi:MAG: ABC transporter ATP-binding protein [Kineosporiaceae bacterium]|nr:ABC transporter ATP-binding protein [Kineosporiaceae bacterium]MBK7623231.1 ABC transporter ATP-binding protein [Kineosporiaceae bacterium]MBK8074817.1 ABC transporter ATP-binding protein [Kineosporiaceae bacterium]
MPLLRRVLPPYRATIMVIFVLLLAQAIAALVLPTLYADIINEGVLLGDTGHIMRLGVIMLVISVVVGFAAIAGTYLSSRVAMSVGRDLRAALFTQVERFSLREVTTFGAPSLITRTTNDVQQLQMLVLMGLNLMAMAPITVIGGVIMAVRENARLSTLLVVIIPIMMAIVLLTLRRALPLFRVVQKRIDAINQVLRENLTGVRVVRAFVRTQHEEARFAEANGALTDTQLAVARLFAFTFPVLMFVINVASVGVVGYGGRLISQNQMQIGTLGAFISYMMQILFSVLMAVMMIAMVPRAAASAERINEVLDTAPAITDADDAVVPTARSAESGEAIIELNKVDFRYPGAEEPVLHDVDLTLRPGQVTAIVGGTGSGKTTLVNLIPRLYDVSDGSLLLDGVDIRRIPREHLWGQLGLVPQKAFLFTGTIADTLRFGAPSATDDELWHALEVAQAADFVRELPDGLAHVVEQGGANFSGGQRQRLAIARALARRPRVYLFDDSFSALDYGTDARLRAALVRETTHAAVVIVAQRVSTVLHADQIVVLDAGRVVGTGRHEELLAGCETYREIVESQLSAQDAA